MAKFFKPKSKSPESTLDEFISTAPSARYTFDSAPDAPESEICRAVENEQQRRDCIMIQMQSKRLFEAMQDHGFFCALPMQPNKTYMECTKLPN
uniref:Uncharacterized protein n=1 Tax=Mycena chlorophos TaxID=658473 RepID=A0ABQ0M8J0_MYCCL|nr:predicted protein [Mycena chlorophos]